MHRSSKINKQKYLSATCVNNLTYYRIRSGTNDCLTWAIDEYKADFAVFRLFIDTHEFKVSASIVTRIENWTFYWKTCSPNQPSETSNKCFVDQPQST